MGDSGGVALAVSEEELGGLIGKLLHLMHGGKNRKIICEECMLSCCILGLAPAVQTNKFARGAGGRQISLGV